MSDGERVQLPVEFLRELSRMAQGGGDPAALARALEGIPGVARFAPTVDVGQNISLLALELGRMLAGSRTDEGEWVFLHNEAVVTVEEKTGRIRGLSAGRFVGYVEQFCAFRGKGGQKREGLSRDDAALVLEQDIFKRALRPLSAVHTMRLPVRRAGTDGAAGTGEVVFLPAGYDEGSGIFTCDLVPYAMDWTVEEGRAWLVEVCHEFDWNGLEETTGEARLEAMLGNRSFAVLVAFVLGSYCRGLFPPGTLRPMAAFFANKPGSGKTRLAEMMLAHVYGFVSSTTAPKDEEKMDVKLETVARAMRPYVILDDIGGSLRSNALNKFITATMHSGRPYHSNSEFFEVPNVTQLVVTANELPTSEDLGRRALVAELFSTGEIRGKRFKRTITPAWLALEETRGRFLSACCALVRNWLAPVNHPEGMGLHPKPLETFEVWTGAIGAMVLLAGLADPLQQAEMDVGGASAEDEMRTLLVKIATGQEGDCVVTRKEMVAWARKEELLAGVLGTEGEGEPDDKALKSFGRKLQRWRAQWLQDERGRKFQFGKKKIKTGATYPLEFKKG